MGKRSILVRQRKGGVAKSTVSIALVNALAADGVSLRLIDADTTDAADDGASLSGVFGDQVEAFAINPEATAVIADPNQLMRHWFPLCSAIMDGDVLVDFGANTNAPFDAALDAGGWAEEFAEAGTDIQVVIPVTANPDAVRGGIEGVESVQRLLPAAGIILAFVQKEGTFDDYRHDRTYQELMALADSGVKMIDVPRCTSTLWRPIEINRLDYVTALAAARADVTGFAERLGMERTDVRMGIRSLSDWYQAVVQEFRNVGLVPHPRPVLRDREAVEI